MSDESIITTLEDCLSDLERSHGDTSKVAYEVVGALARERMPNDKRTAALYDLCLDLELPDSYHVQSGEESRAQLVKEIHLSLSHLRAARYPDVQPQRESPELSNRDCTSNDDDAT